MLDAARGQSWFAPATIEAVSANADLAGDLSAAAHLIHGSSEQRFPIRWCPGQISKEQVVGVRFEYPDLKTMLALYDLRKLRHGHNRDQLCVEVERGQ